MMKPIDQQIDTAKAQLFDDLPEFSEAQQAQHVQVLLAIKRSEGTARLLQPNRLQVELRASNLESLLPEDGEEAQELYKQRAATAECVNAQSRNRGLLQMPARGLPKVRSVVGLFVLAHNLMRMVKLAPQLIGWGITPSKLAAQAA